jgi:hypothetical protein
MGILTKVADLNHPAAVGERYLVLAVYTRDLCMHHLRRPSWLPLLGDPHTDAELLPGADPHWHIDMRFVTDAQLAALRHGHHYTTVGPPRPGIEYSMVFYHGGRGFTSPRQPTILRGPELRPMICRRQFDFPEFGSRSLTPKLARYLRPLGSCWTCPHRGFNLKQVPPNAEGVIVCPGHGLRFHLDGTPAPAPAGVREMPRLEVPQ